MDSAAILAGMARKARVAPGGWVYHVLNRSVGRMRMLRTQKDFAAFDRVIAQAHERCPLRILSYCLMGNHWHFIAWPRKDGELTEFFRWMAHTHAMRWRVSHHTVGHGHLYQGRYKSFPVQTDESLLKACRYVERNALTAGVVERAEDWRWGSLWVRAHGTAEQRAVLSDWPVERPPDWTAWVNAAITAKERLRWESSLSRNRPFGDDQWTARAAKQLRLEHTIRSEGGAHGRKSSDA
jgi:putative transposase